MNSFDVYWLGKRFLTGAFVFGLDGLKLSIHVKVERPIKDIDYKEIWNTAGNGIPLDWNRHFYHDEWLWPHLYKLLNGDYGGEDKAKEVKNDFGAVLVRTFDSMNKEVGKPQVSAKWSQVGGTKDISHEAKSSTFQLSAQPCSTGSVRIWFVYLDTQQYRPGEEPAEWAGYTLAYVEGSWETNKTQITVGKLSHRAVPPKTEFKWEAWTPDQSPPSFPRP